MILHRPSSCSSKSKFRRIKIYNLARQQSPTARNCLGFLLDPSSSPDEPITNKCFSFCSTHISKRIERAYPLLRLRSAGQRQPSRKLKVNGTRARTHIDNTRTRRMWYVATLTWISSCPTFSTHTFLAIDTHSQPVRISYIEPVTPSERRLTCRIKAARWPNDTHVYFIHPPQAFNHSAVRFVEFPYPSTGIHICRDARHRSIPSTKREKDFVYRVSAGNIRG